MGTNSFDFSNKRYVIDKDFYDGLWQKYRKKIVLDLIGKEKKVLDVGCYDGTYMNFIKKKGNIVYGIEASEDAVFVAKKNNLQVIQGDLEKKWDFEDNFFDVVYAGEIIEHIVDTDFFVSEARRVLKQGGYFIVTTPNLAALSKRILLLLGKNPYQEASFSYPEGAVGHIREFTYDLLKGFLRQRGFILTEFRTDVVSVPFFPDFFQRFLAFIFPKLGRSLIVKFKKFR